jgi:putative DNA primase/helicase
MSSTPFVPTVWEAALAYAEFGIPIFPVYQPIGQSACSCRKTNCSKIGKHPRTENGLRNATRDRNQILYWNRRYPDTNLAGLMGNGIFALDIDPAKGRWDSLEALQKQYGELPHTVTSKTGSGGEHRLFRVGEGITVANAVGVLDGLDIRGDNGYIVLPPSLHVSGQHYEWINSPFEQVLSEAPDWLVEIVKKKTKSYESHVASQNNDITKGMRNDTLLSLGRSLRAKGINAKGIHGALLAINEAQCIPPLSSDDINTLAKNVCKKPAGDIVPRHRIELPPIK